MHSNSHAEIGELLLSFFPKTSIPQNQSLKRSLKALTHHSNPNHAKRASDLLRLCVGFHEKRLTPGQRLYNSEEVFHHCYQRLQVMRQETLMLMLVDGENRYHSDVLVSTGGTQLNASRMDNLLAPVLERGMSRFVMVQHHLTGIGMPEKLDDNIDGLVRTTAQLLELELIDHLLIHGESYYSYLAKDMYVPFAVSNAQDLKPYPQSSN